MSGHVPYTMVKSAHATTTLRLLCSYNIYQYSRLIIQYATVIQHGRQSHQGAHMQVAPSFFDAPGAQAAAKVTPRPKGGLTLPASFTSPLGGASPASTQRFHADLPDVTFAFVSESGYKVRTHTPPPPSTHPHTTLAMLFCGPCSRPASQILTECQDTPMVKVDAAYVHLVSPWLWCLCCWLAPLVLCMLSVGG